MIGCAQTHRGTGIDASRVSPEMSRIPASITQADIARALRAARQAGAAEVEIRIDGKVSLFIRLEKSSSEALAQTEEIIL